MRFKQFFDVRLGGPVSRAAVADGNIDRSVPVV
jgi:hypothetical protein